jgi:hypothetical protein
MRRFWLSLLLGAAALPAAGQPAPAPPPPRDSIGDILDRRVPLPKDEDEPDTAGQPRTAPEPEPSGLPTNTPPAAYRAGPRPQMDAPVHIDETGKTPDGPPAVRDMAYDSRIRSSFASAESFQGPLDGGWTLASRGADIYAFQIVDRRDRLEAVWRDLRRTGSLSASGLVDDIQRAGGGLTLRFADPSTVTALLTLHPGADGRWTGDLVRGDEKFTVILRRTGP